MKRFLAFLCLMIAFPVFAQQVVVTGSIPQYAFGQVSEKIGDITQGRATVNANGYFSMQLANVPSHTLVITPAAGSAYTQYSVSVSVRQGPVDITPALLAAMPTPAPTAFQALSTTSGIFAANGITYKYPAVQAATSCATNDGAGNISWGPCSYPAFSTSGLIADYDFTSCSLADKTGTNANATMFTTAPTCSSLTHGYQFTSATTGTNAQMNLPASINSWTSLEFDIYLPPLPFSQGFPLSATYLHSLLGVNNLNQPWFFLDKNGQGQTQGIFQPQYFNGSTLANTADLLTGYNHVAITCGSTSHVYINGVESNSYIVQSACLANTLSAGQFFTVGSGNNNAGASNQTVYRVRVFNTQIPATQIASDAAASRGYLASQGVQVQPVQQRSAKLSIYGFGDSHMSCLGLTTAQCWMNNLSTSPNTYTPVLYSISNFTILGILGQIPWQGANVCQSTGGPNIAVIDAGTNDMAIYGATAQQTAQMIASGVRMLKQAGCIVAVGTTFSRFSSATNFDSIKNTLNPLIRGYAKSWGADMIFDFGSQPLIAANGAYANTTYFQGDQTHLTLTGEQLEYPIASAAIVSYFGATSITPTVTTAATYQALASDNFIIANPTTNSQVLTLPTCIGRTTPININNVQQTGVNTLTVKTFASAETVDGVDYSSTGLVVSNVFDLQLTPLVLSQATAQCTWTRR